MDTGVPVTVGSTGDSGLGAQAKTTVGGSKAKTTVSGAKARTTDG